MCLVEINGHEAESKSVILEGPEKMIFLAAELSAINWLVDPLWMYCLLTTEQVG